MRLRRKKHLDIREQNVADVLLKTEKAELNALEAAKNKCLIDVNEVFGNDNPLVLEIGCGMGNFAITYAETHPDKNVLAVEIITNVIVTACEKAQEKHLSNLKFLCTGAEYLPKYLKEHSVERIYLNFSTPFQKNSYKNRRLTNERFLEIYEKLLADGGEVRQKTDDLDFFEYSLEEFTKCGWTTTFVTRDLHAEEIADNIITEYESKFIKQNKKICAIYANKKER